MMLVEAFSIALWLCATALACLGTYRVWDHFRRGAGPSFPARHLEPISILKPIKGAEPGLEKNLRTFFELDYFLYEVIFSVADESDPACAVIRRLVGEFPEVAARLIVGAVSVGPNPKVNNLIRSYGAATYDWVLISDSNTRVTKDHLYLVAREFGPDVGVVTAVVRGHAPETFGGYLEAVFLNTFYARWMLIARSFGQDVVVGKSMLFRKSTAARFGGFLQLGRFLAEDFMTGRAVRMLGLKVVIMSTPVLQPLSRYSFRDFWRRHIRWGRIRKAQAPLPVFFEPWLGLIPSGLIGAFGLHALFGFSFARVFAAHAALWLTCDMAIISFLGERLRIGYALAWLAREILAIPLWAQMMCGDTVDWRGVKFKVKPGGLLET